MSEQATTNPVLVVRCECREPRHDGHETDLRTERCNERAQVAIRYTTDIAASPDLRVKVCEACGDYAIANGNVWSVEPLRA